MCGIFLHLSDDVDVENVRRYGEKIKHRGPDSTVEKTIHDEGKTALFSVLVV